MNKIVSVPSEPQSPKNRPETQTPSVPITSLKKAMAFVNAQTHLSTEDLFKTLLVYHKPNQGMFATPRDPQFLNEAINKGASSEGPVSAETQQRIALAIRDGQFGTPIPENVARAIATKLDAFTDREAQRNISEAIRDGQFGTPIRENVARAIATKLDAFTAPEAQRKSPFPPYFMSASFPFLDVKSVVKLLRVNNVVRTDMTAFLKVFRNPYDLLSTPIPAGPEEFRHYLKLISYKGGTSIPTSAEAFQYVMETLERSVRDLGYGRDKVTMRLLQTPPRLTRDQLQAIPISPITIVYLLQNPANRQPLVAAGVHTSLSALLSDPQATPEAKEWAAEALCNLSLDPANGQALVADGVHNSLSALLIDSLATPEAKQWAAGALRHLSYDPANRQRLMAAGVHIPLSAFLIDPQATAEAKELAVGALWVLSHTPANRQRLVADRVHIYLGRLLSDPQSTPLSKEWAARVLGILSDNPANRLILVADDVHIPLSALLSDPQATARAKECASGVLCNLSYDPANRQPLVAAGVHNPLSALLIDP